MRSSKRLRVLGLERNGRRLFAYEMRLNRVPLGELSLEQFIEVIGSPPR